MRNIILKHGVCLILLTLTTGLQASFDGIYKTKLQNLDNIAALDVMKYYNSKEKALLAGAIDDMLTWIRPIREERYNKVLSHELISSSQVSLLQSKYQEITSKDMLLDQYLAESPAFAFGTGYTKSQWSRIHRTAHDLFEMERSMLRQIAHILNELQKKEASIAAEKKKAEEEQKKKEEAEKAEEATRAEMAAEAQRQKEQEVNIYKFITFGLLAAIGIWMFFYFGRGAADEK